MLPLLLLAGTAVGLGANSKLNAEEAMRVTEQAQDEYASAIKKFKKTQKKTQETIAELGKTKLYIYGNQITEFVSVFSQLKETQLQEGKGLEEIAELPFHDMEVEKMHMDSLESIKFLESNPTADALISWGIGGIFGLAFYNSKMKEKRDNAYADLALVKKKVAEMELVEDEFYIIQKNAEQLQCFYQRLAKIMDLANQNMKEIVQKKKMWSAYQEEEKNKIIVAMKTVQLLKAMIDLPLLGEDGTLTKDICDVLSQRENVLQVLGCQVQ